MKKIKRGFHLFWRFLIINNEILKGKQKKEAKVRHKRNTKRTRAKRRELKRGLSS